MAELNDVYGTNYQSESQKSKINYILNTIVNNIAHRQFNFRLFESLELWTPSHELSQQSIDTIIQKTKTINKQMCVVYIDKKSNMTNMLPELVVDAPVEYFLIIDGEFHRSYFIYITPYEVNAF